MAGESDLVAATTTCFLGSDPWVAFDCLRSVGVRYVEVPALPARQSVEWRQTTFSPETLGPTGAQRLRERLAEMDLIPITVGAYASVLHPTTSSRCCCASTSPNNWVPCLSSSMRP